MSSISSSLYDVVYRPSNMFKCMCVCVIVNFFFSRQFLFWELYALMLSENGVNFFTGLSAQLEKERKTEREIYSFCHSYIYIFIFIYIYMMCTVPTSYIHMEATEFRLTNVLLRTIRWLEYTEEKSKNQLNQKQKKRLEET